MKFVGEKEEIYSGTLPETQGYPALKLSDFQEIFQFLSNEKESNLRAHAVMARSMVHSEINEQFNKFGSIDALSEATFGDEETGFVLYRQAVFALAATFVIGVQISTDTTKEAAGRQDALEYKKGECNVMYRRAVDMLVHGYETFTFEVV